MESASPRRASPALSPARIETLADGVFAIAMTLLVLDLAVPDVPPEGLLLPPFYILPGGIDRYVFRRRS